MYIVSPDPFAEVDAFVDESAAVYRLDLARYAMPMREAFRVYLEEHRSVKAILVGTRRTDPHGATLTHFDQTDQGWPDFMRVHPVIDWHYAEIWAVSFHRWACVCAGLMCVSLFGILRFLTVHYMTGDTHPWAGLRTRTRTRR